MRNYNTGTESEEEELEVDTPELNRAGQIRHFADNTAILNDTGMSNTF
jgi:hypothetical protein